MPDHLPAVPAGASSPRHAVYRARPSGRSRVGVVLAAVAFGAALLLVVLRLVQQYGPPEVQARTVGFTITPTEVRITALVNRDPARDAICLFRARDAGGAEVGHAEVRVVAEPAASRDVRVVVRLPTSVTAVTGETGRCLAVAPGSALPAGEPVVLPEPASAAAR